MIRHIVMSNFKAEVDQPEREEFAKKAVEILTQLPGVHNLVLGQALEVRGQVRYGMALFIDFDDEAALKSYLDHPKHKAVAAKLPSVFSDILVSDYLY